MGKKWNMHIRNCHNQKKASPRSQKVERTREHAFIHKRISFKLTSQTIHEKENHWGYRLGTVSSKIVCHWGFKPGSRVHQPYTCPNRFSYEQTSTSCLGEITRLIVTAEQSDVWFDCCKACPTFLKCISGCRLQAFTGGGRTQVRLFSHCFMQ
jgi:hypothetical protein